MEWKDGKIRCRWANPGNERYIHYHDHEWGVPVHDDRKLFEMLVLEGFQAGLSWECVLNKREAFSQAFDGFDLEKVMAYEDEKLEELQNDPGTSTRWWTAPSGRCGIWTRWRTSSVSSRRS